VNIGNDREIPVIEVARYIQRSFPHCPIVHLPPTPQDPTNRRPDLTVANRVIPGWSCAVPYEEGVDRTIAWFQAQLATEAAQPLAPAPVLDEPSRAGEPILAPPELVAAAALGSASAQPLSR